MHYKVLESDEADSLNETSHVMIGVYLDDDQVWVSTKKIVIQNGTQPVSIPDTNTVQVMSKGKEP